MTMCPLPDPDAWEVTPTGAHKTIDRQAIQYLELQETVRDLRGELIATRCKLAEADAENESLRVKLTCAKAALKLTDSDLAELGRVVTSLGRILEQEKIRAQA